MNCPKCGSPQRDGAVFCNVCGAQLNTPVDPAPSGKSVSSSWAYGGFAARYVGIIVFGSLFFLYLVLFVLASGLKGFAVFRNFFPQIVPLGFAAMGMIVAGRAGGFDLSIAGLMSLAPALLAMFASQAWGAGMVVALIVCLIIGLINGVFTVFLRIPSILVTLITLLLARGFANQILNGRMVRLPRFPMEVFYVLFVLAIAGAFLFIFFTKLGKPFPQRDQGQKPVWLTIFAYLFSSGMACLAGLALACRVNAASAALGNGTEFTLLLLLLIAGSSTLWDNRVTPVPVMLVAWFFISIWTFAMNILAVNPILQTSATAGYLLLAVALDRVYRRNIFPFKPLDSKA